MPPLKGKGFLVGDYQSFVFLFYLYLCQEFQLLIDVQDIQNFALEYVVSFSYDLFKKILTRRRSCLIEKSLESYKVILIV